MAWFGLGSNNGPTKINQVRINQSVLGYAVGVVMGRGKIQQALLWLDGFSSKKFNPGGGKGIGGGKGTEYDYSADVIAAICAGPIASVNDVWSGQSWLSNTAAAETWTIGTGGFRVYNPANSSSFESDNGVSLDVTHSGTFTDLGAPSSVTLSGTSPAAFQRIQYGETPSTGQYTVNPANGQYGFAPDGSDDGKTVNLSYTFALGYIKQQEIDFVPGSKQIDVGGTIPFYQDGGVIYYAGPSAGQALRKVSGTPSATGTYSVTGSAPATYKFAAGDINAFVQITYKLNNTSALPSGLPTSLNFIVFAGEKSQLVWSLLASKYPGAALGYTGIGLVAYAPMDLGSGASVQQNTFEVQTYDSWGGGIVDCNPVQAIRQVLTNEVWGMGRGQNPFPAFLIDDGPSGSWGPGKSSGGLQQDSTSSTWFAANGFFITPVIDRQDTAASLISAWLEAGQVAAFMSEGLLKLRPYGDTTTAGNGCTWVGPSAFAAALDDTCFVQKTEGDDPVKISEPVAWTDAYTKVQVTWSNRSNQYADETTQEGDEAAINRLGEILEDAQTWDFITTLPSATFAASARVKRLVYVRMQYEFPLPFRYSFLEPMDVVDITTSSDWDAGENNANLAVVNRPVRIVKIVDNPDGSLDITAEDYPFGAHQPVIYNKDLAAGEVQQNLFADPGTAEVVLFEAPNRLASFQGRQIWIGACGTSDDWGGCNVLVSEDGTKYQSIGAIETAGRLGVLVANIATGSDPDTSNSLVVQLAENSAALVAGTTGDADQGNTALFVDGEIINYSAATITGQDQYTLDTYLRRGQMGTNIGPHSIGGLVLRLDDAIFKYTFDPSWTGKTISLKFQSFNRYGNALQDESILTPVSFAIAGADGAGSIDASSGLILENPGGTAHAVTVLGTSKPWDPSLGGNSSFVFGDGTGTAPLSIPVQAGGQVTISATGAVTPHSGSGAFGPNGGSYSTESAWPGSPLYPLAYVSGAGATTPIQLGGLMGAFADAAGNVITPVAISDTFAATVPSGATQLLLGVNDDVLSDNTGSFNVAAVVLAPGIGFYRPIAGPVKPRGPMGWSGRAADLGFSRIHGGPARHWGGRT